jgi:glyoxylase-like metal-dependent hydrolase (beta-lactamase superfamily II)
MDDDFFAQSKAGNTAARELGFEPPDPADLRLKDGEILTAGDLSIKVIHTPGHTPGSVCFLLDGNLFTGDTLFVGAVGRTDLRGGSFDTLLNSIKTRLLSLPGDTVILPGHDYGERPTSTMKREIEENPYITDFIL